MIIYFGKEIDMIIKRENGTYSGDYIFKSEQRITRDILEKALTRIKTYLSFNELNGEILYAHNLRDRYSKQIRRFFEIPVIGPIIRIYSVEIVDDEDNIGLRIVFKPRFSGMEEEEAKDNLIKWIETNQMCLIPRMIGSKHEEVIDHFDIITFDLMPKDGANININEFIRKV